MSAKRPLAEVAGRLGLDLRPGTEGELWARCTEDEFAELVVAMAETAFLADLFATDDDGRATLRAVLEMPGDDSWLVLSTRLSGDGFVSLTPRLHAASWYEREIRELHGLEPRGHPAPVLLRLHRESGERVPVVRGQGVFQLPLGPVRSGPQESAEFLFNSGGEDLVMVSPLLGYKMRAVERLAEGRTPEQALVLAERLAGTSCFANALAFVQAAERALGRPADGRAALLRSLMGELERLHSHFGDLGRVAEATGLMVAGAQYAILKEEVLRACAALTGHRYLRGILAVGGLAADVPPAALEALRRRVPRWRQRASTLDDLLEGTATFVDRLDGTAFLTSRYAAQHNLVGPVGRSTGADRDSRRDHPYAGYRSVEFEVPIQRQGDALARCRVRLAEIAQSLQITERLAERCLQGAPPHQPSPPSAEGARQAGEEAATGEGPGARSALGWSEAPGGQTLHFVALDDAGLIARWRARTPAFVNWHPYAQACASGNNLTDYPVIEASFGLSHAEFDR
jgi:Ni,Fe-hydrogenase III large subunit/Ni,Fe-hydrogenase III component G